jgi:DNA repair protein RecN (Recombination protein N)
MLVEIRVRDLGVIDKLDLSLGPGMTALTGETGAGKTLVVEALELLVGGRADTALVRRGAAQAFVEGRFLLEGPPSDGSLPREVIVSREIPADGRARAYLDGRMATVATLADIGATLVDLHGQHSHQSLLHQESQRRALDHFGGVDLAEVEMERAAIRQLDERLAELGGDERQLAREVDLLRYQVAELEAAALGDPDEESLIGSEVRLLSTAESLRQAVSEASGLLTGSSAGHGDESSAAGGLLGAPDALEAIGRATSLLAQHEQLGDLSTRLQDAAAEVADVAADLRRRADGVEDDPVRLEELMNRLRLLGDLRRKYGDTLADVIEYERSTRERLADLEAGEERRSALVSERSRRVATLAEVEERAGDARRAAAGALAAAVERHLAELALPKARLQIRLPERGLADEVTWLFGANAGEAALPLAKVASGGELARAMLATRLVLSEAPPTLIFDEVDAGVGGEAALAVGRALHQLADAGHQVLVVTHLPQVAAFADAHVAVSKEERDGRTIASARAVAGEERLTELSRMLSGQPASAVARRHAEELLALAWG